MTMKELELNWDRVPFLNPHCTSKMREGWKVNLLMK